MKEHKPCPFCGGTAVIIRLINLGLLDDGTYFKTHCVECGSCGAIKPSLTEAWAFWDRR